MKPEPTSPFAEHSPRPGLLSAVPLYALVLSLLALLGVVGGLILAAAGQSAPAFWVWIVATLPGLAALLVEIAVALPQGKIGLDVLAGLSMTVALVMGEPLAANVVGLMYAGGQLLERYAEGHARREMTALLGRVATTAMRYVDHSVAEVAITALVPGDRVLVRQGEVLPVDGTVLSEHAILDEAALTGEALPVTHNTGDEVLSGSTLAGPAFDLLVTRPAAESTYAGIVRLVERAQKSRAPMVRLADRYALGFLAFSVGLAGLAWFLSGDPQRFLAVLVVATPCPLILAVPVAVISGMSSAARAGALFKDGAAMEAMAQIHTVVLDKTGTLTHGEARVQAIHAASHFGEAELLQLAASLDQASGHVVARALVAEAHRRGIVLVPPLAIAETPGSGIEGSVGSSRVAVGSYAFVIARCSAGDIRLTETHAATDRLSVSVGIDGHFAGLIVLADELRGEASETLAALRAAGVRRIVLASGDKRSVAEATGQALGVDATLFELPAEAKAAVIARERQAGPVMMVGDGINDAPALAAADVGVAMGARGAAASSEAASVVVLVDRLEPLAHAVVIARRTRKIALESVFIGLGLSIVGMLIASTGVLPPVGGALLQEGIDVAVILNALRALR